MNNPKYINNIDLEFLSKSSLQKNFQNDKSISKDDIDFYYKRIIQTTKELCKNKIDNSDLKSIFDDFVYAVIYKLKREDEQELYQEEYNNIKFKKNNNSSNCEELDNNIIFNKNKTSNLNNFVISSPLPSEKKIVPLKKDVNIKQERFRTKGIVEKKN